MKIFDFGGTNMNNIILIGMPGSGKSTVGVVLAKMLGYNFIDTDLLIQEQNGALLQDIIDRDGNEAFLETEARSIKTLDCEKSVIATGGSAVLHPEGLKKLKNLGALVYLRHPFGEIDKRISNLDSRGVTLGEGQTLRDLYDYREPIYRSAADITINAEGLEIEETAQKIIQKYNEYISGC